VVQPLQEVCKDLAGLSCVGVTQPAGIACRHRLCDTTDGPFV
jgi:hypothetical protein